MKTSRLVRTGFIFLLAFLVLTDFGVTQEKTQYQSQVVGSKQSTSVWNVLYSMWDSIADSDFDSAAERSREIDRYRPDLEANEREKSPFPAFAASETRVFASMSNVQKRQVSDAFRAIRASGVTGQKSDDTFANKLRHLTRAEKLLQATSKQCPNTYCRIAAGVARQLLQSNQQDVAALIASRARQTALLAWGKDDSRTAALICLDISIRHFEQLPSRDEADELRIQLLNVGERTINPVIACSATSLYAMCGIREREFQTVVTLTDHTKSKHVDELDEDIVAMTRVSLLRAHALAEIGRTKEAILEYEAIKKPYVDNYLDHRVEIAAAFDAIRNAYISEKRVEEAPKVAIAKRKCIERIAVGRMIDEYKCGWIPKGVRPEELRELITTQEIKRQEFRSHLVEGDLAKAHEIALELRDATAQTVELRDPYTDFDWIEVDLQQRLLSKSKVSRTERLAISTTWRVLWGEPRVHRQILADKEKMCAAIDANHNQDSAGAFYLRLAIAIAFQKIGQFDDANRELECAQQILTRANRDKDLVALIVSRERLLNANFARNSSFRLSDINLPSDLDIPRTLYGSLITGEFCNLLAVYCYLNGDDIGAICFAQDGISLFNHKKVENKSVLAQVLYGPLIHYRASYRRGLIAQSDALNKLNGQCDGFERVYHFRNQFSIGYYELAADFADELLKPQLAESLRNKAKEHSDAIRDGREWDNPGHSGNE